MEFGPRALGARSLLGDARRRDMQTVMNVKIKFRESFRPFAPVVLEEYADDYFKLDEESPYMLLVGPVQEKHRRGQVDETKTGIALLGSGTVGHSGRHACGLQCARADGQS